MEPIIWLGVLAVLLVIRRAYHGTYYDLVCRRRTCCRYCSRHWNGNRAAASSVFLCFTGAAVFTRPAALKLMRKDTEKQMWRGLLGKKGLS